MLIVTLYVVRHWRNTRECRVTSGITSDLTKSSICNKIRPDLLIHVVDQPYINTSWRVK